MTSNTLVISHLLGRDKNQKVWAIAKNKWGKVTSSQVTLKVPNEEDAAPKVQDDSSELSTRRESFALSLNELTSSGSDASNSSKSKLALSRLMRKPRGSENPAPSSEASTLDATDNAAAADDQNVRGRVMSGAI